MGRALAIRIFLTCWIVYSAYFTPFIVREHFPAVSLTERGSLNVERYTGWIEDIFVSPRGGAYINNNPGASLSGAIPLLLFRPLLDSAAEWERSSPPRSTGRLEEPLLLRIAADRRSLYFMLVGFLTVAGLMAPLTAASAAFLAVKVYEVGVSVRWAAACALLFAFGTPLFFRTGYLNHNMLVADVSVTAFLLLWDKEAQTLGPWRAMTAGLLAGYAVLCDLSGLVVVAGVGLYTLLRAQDGQSRPWKVTAAFSAGVLPGVAILLIYFYTAFGEPFRPSQHYMPPTSPTSQGYRGFDWVSPALIQANFFDRRFGLFAFCPVLLLAFAAPFLETWRRWIPRREAAVLAIYATFFVFFCAANQYSWLQPNTGFRYLAPAVFVFYLFTAQALAALPPVWRYVLAGIAVVQSILTAAAHIGQPETAVSRLLTSGWQLPWMRRAAEFGLIESNWVWPVCLHAVIAFACFAIWSGFGAQSEAQRSGVAV